MLDDISLSSDGLEFDEIASVACCLHGLSFAILKGRRADAGAGKAAFSAALGLDRNRTNLSFAPIGRNTKVPARHEALE